MLNRNGLLRYGMDMRNLCGLIICIIEMQVIP